MTGTTTALLRHFADLRDGTHGHTPAPHESSRAAKERLFADSAGLLDGYARAALIELNTALLLDTGLISTTGVRRDEEGGLEARWELTWPEQRDAGVDPIRLHAHYGAAFHHPHLRGATVGDWPLNVFTDEQAAEELPVLRAIVAADLHNLVFRCDYRLVPAVVEGSER